MKKYGNKNTKLRQAVTGVSEFVAKNRLATNIQGLYNNRKSI